MLPNSLKQPPIDEVICGFRFAAIPSFTSPEHGRYWVEREADFPHAEQKEAVLDPLPVSGFFEFPVRTWLVAVPDNRLVQLQSDRFYVNWRRRSVEDAYPHFKDREPDKGIGSYAFAEFEKFEAFLARRHEAPRVTHVELSKIDVLHEGVHWKQLSDLPRLFPMLSGLSRIAWARDYEFNQVYASTSGSIRETLSIATGTHSATGTRVVRIEHKSMDEADREAALRKLFALNEHANAVFFSILSEELLGKLGPNE